MRSLLHWSTCCTSPSGETASQPHPPPELSLKTAGLFGPPATGMEEKEEGDEGEEEEREKREKRRRERRW